MEKSPSPSYCSQVRIILVKDKVKNLFLNNVFFCRYWKLDEKAVMRDVILAIRYFFKAIYSVINFAFIVFSINFFGVRIFSRFLFVFT